MIFELGVAALIVLAFKGRRKPPQPQQSPGFTGIQGARESRWRSRVESRLRPTLPAKPPLLRWPGSTDAL